MIVNLLLYFCTHILNSNDIFVEELFLDSNQLNGTLDECIGTDLRRLIKLHLFGNQLSGDIPSSLGQLKSLGKI